VDARPDNCTKGHSGRGKENLEWNFKGILQTPGKKSRAQVMIQRAIKSHLVSAGEKLLKNESPSTTRRLSKKRIEPGV